MQLFTPENAYLWIIILCLLFFIGLSRFIPKINLINKNKKYRNNDKISPSHLRKNNLTSKRYKIWKDIRKEKAINLQIPLFCRSLSEALESGYNIEQALEFVSPEITDPLQKILKEIMTDLALHRSLTQSLQEIARKYPQKDLQFFCTALAIQYQSGGNITQSLKLIAKNIETRSRIEADLKSFTSQGRLSGYFLIGLMPVSLLVFSLISPAHTDILYQTSNGNIILALAILLEVIGAIMIWKILNPKI